MIVSMNFPKSIDHEFIYILMFSDANFVKESFKYLHLVRTTQTKSAARTLLHFPSFEK